MSVIDLLKRDQKKFVESDRLGVGESIIYNHNSGLVENNIRAFVGSEEYNKTEKDDKRKDMATFSNVILQEEPTKLDIIEYDGFEWSVRDWTKAYGFYLIKTDKNKRNKVFK
jgi:hypothetical protein